MSKSLAIEYAKKNININCISPGFIKTAMTDKIDEKYKEILLFKTISLDREMKILQCCSFLAQNN